MRILLDESVPERLGELLSRHVWSTVGRENLATLPMSILVMRAKSNRLGDLSPIVPDVLAALATLGPREFAKVPR